MEKGKIGENLNISYIYSFEPGDIRTYKYPVTLSKIYHTPTVPIHISIIDYILLIDCYIRMEEILPTVSPSYLSPLAHTHSSMVLARTPFSELFLQHNSMKQQREMAGDFEVLCAALSTDFLAGSPLVEYCAHLENEQATADLKFWTLAQQVCSILP